MAEQLDPRDLFMVLGQQCFYRQMLLEQAQRLAAENQALQARIAELERHAVAGGPSKE